MIRENVRLRALRGERYFRWRGGEVSRLEGITDGVIALAMTLLIVSLEVPDTFDALMESFRAVPAFAICFALMGMIWYYHYQFHRRFGLENWTIVVLNMGLLFLILVYVYPLKFLFTALTGPLTGQPVRFRQPAQLMLLYSGGVVGIFLIFTLMNLYAYRHRETLELSEVECLVTRAAIGSQIIHVLVGLASMFLALAGQAIPAGLIYFAVGPAQGIHGWLWGRRIEARAAQDS